MPRGITDVLKDIRDGALLTELPLCLTELVTAVKATGKAGKLTITFNIKPLNGKGNQVLVTDDCRLTLPEPDRETTLLYVTDDNELTRRDPRQPKLPEMGVVRSIHSEGGEAV